MYNWFDGCTTARRIGAHSNQLRRYYVGSGRIKGTTEDGWSSAWPVALVLLVSIPHVYCTRFLDQDTAMRLIEEEHPIEAHENGQWTSVLKRLGTPQSSAMTACRS